jgi:hypothetical protein
MRAALLLVLALGVPSPSAAESVDFELEHGLITVPVRVGGDTLPLMLDLGDFRAISLTTAVLDTIDVEYTGEVDVFANFAGDEMEARRFVVSDVGLGAVRHDRLEGGEDVHDPSNPSPNPYGAIGRTFFDGRLLTIDYANTTLDVGGAPVTDGACIPLDPTFGMLRVDATIDGRDVVLLVDTGAQVSVIDPGVFAENTRFQDTHSAYRAGSLELGGVDRGEVTLLRLDLGSTDFDGILGSDVLRRYVVRIDLRQNCLEFVERG